MEEIYLDNSATTRPLPEVAEIINRVLTKDYGNPSSLHNKGLEAEKLLKKTRKLIALKLGVSPEEICFTSGGTESNNLAIKG
ncbi:MAG TPA: aminotransferase class V-fold PLP-dependent enzyme, partial [Halanaerobiales bacterium]|nr:aminotransferase class V-fold PLP-dependent enzyme [Halanaerobiales bacterium]